MISLRRTEILIDRCIRLYLQSWLIPRRDIRNGKTPQAQRDTHSSQERDFQHEVPMSLPNLDRRGDIMLDIDSRYDYLQHIEEQPSRAEMPTLSSSLPTVRVQVRPNAGPLPVPSGIAHSMTLPLTRASESAGLEASQNKEKAIPPSIFRHLERYIICCFRDIDSLNASFSSHKPAAPIRSVSEDAIAALHKAHNKSDMLQPVGEPFEMDAKTLLLGDVAENGGSYPSQTTLSVNSPLMQIISVVVGKFSNEPRLILFKWIRYSRDLEVDKDQLGRIAQLVSRHS